MLRGNRLIKMVNTDWLTGWIQRRGGKWGEGGLVNCVDLGEVGTDTAQTLLTESCACETIHTILACLLIPLASSRHECNRLICSFFMDNIFRA